MKVEVSVIISSYNKAKFIEDTILSVLSQTSDKFELIIIDDASTDETATILKKYQNHPSVVICLQTNNNGANFCRNIGLQKANGKYIVFLDADDILAADCLKGRLKIARDHPEKDLLVFSMGVFRNEPGDDSRQWNPVTSTPLEDFLQHKLAWSIVQPLWKKVFLVSIGGFDETFYRLQDVELSTRALLQPTIGYLLCPGEPDCYYRIDDKRKTFNNYTFLTKWVDSAIQYCEKFAGIIHPNQNRYLKGTMFQTYVSLLLSLKNKEISKAEFHILEKSILETSLIKNRKTRFLFNVSRFYNLKLNRIPGFNRLIKIFILTT